MSLTLYVVVLVAGMLLGPALVVGIAPVFDGVAKKIVRIGIRSGGDWILKPVGGTRYALEQVEYDDAEGKAWRVGDDEDPDREYYDDHGGRMRTLFGKSFGLAVDDVAAIVDPVDAKLGELEGEKATDGGQVSSQSTWTLEELRDRAHIGTAEQTVAEGVMRRVEFVNPFVSVGEEDNGTIVDIRDAVTLLSSNASPETPRKTAENAAAAERAFEDWGELKRNASLLASAVVGAVIYHFAQSGGGGGGGPEVPVSVDATPLLDVAMPLLLGVL